MVGMAAEKCLARPYERFSQKNESWLIRNLKAGRASRAIVIPPHERGRMESNHKSKVIPSSKAAKRRWTCVLGQTESSDWLQMRVL